VREGATNLREGHEMKIAYVLGRFPSVSETFVAREIVAHLEAGVDIQIFSLFEPNTNVIHEFVKSNNFASMIQCRNFDLIHSHFSFFLAFMVSMLCGKRMTFTIHNPPLSFDNDFSSKMKFLFREVAGVIAISNMAKSVLLKLSDGTQNDKIHVIHCGVDTGFYTDD